MHTLFKELKYALRGFAKTPGFTTVAVLALALGIGANTAIFSVVRGVLLRPLPYENPDRLAMIWGELAARDVQNWLHSPLDYLDYKEATLFEDVAGVTTFNQTLTGDGDPQRIVMGGVTENFFTVLGIQPALGRAFLPEDGTPFTPGDDPNAAPPPTMVLLSHGLWQRRFGGDGDVVGRSIEVNGNPATVVGVLPQDFRLHMPAASALAANVDMWSALRLNFDNAQRGNVFLNIIGRLHPGVTVAQAQAEMDGIATRLREELQLYEGVGFQLEVVPLHEDLTQTVRPVVMALMGAVGFVLLIACANVANLLLVRATARVREICIRAALGGSRGRLIRQMLIESTVLAAMGAGVGLLLAQGGIDLLVALEPGELPRLDTIRIDGTVLGFTLLASLAAALLFGTLPALQASKANLTDALKSRSDLSVTRSQTILRSAMVVVEVALSLVLLVGAGLMIRSFVALQQVDPGFNPNGVLTFQAPLPNGLATAQQRTDFQRQLQRQIAGLPGVQSASAVFPLPLSGLPFNSRYGLEDALEDERNFKQAEYRMVLPDYFKTMETQLLAGRTFSEAEYNDSASVVVIDEVLAEKTWPGESPVGKRLLVRQLNPTPVWVDVIGVVRHQRHATLAEVGRETIFFTDRWWGTFGGMTWTVRATGDPLNLVGPIRSEILAVAPTSPMADVRTMTSYVGEARADTRFSLILIGVFGVTALVLASVGLYGVLSYVVRQRTAEIGIRMAFGAPPNGILKLVVKQGLMLALGGVGIGLILSLAVTRFMSSMLVGVSATDPVTLVGVAALFAAVAVLASYVPAKRATRIDPAIALREE